MKRCRRLGLGFALLAVPPLLAAQQAPSGAGAQAADYAAELQQLSQEFRQAQQAFYEQFREDMPQEEMARLFSDPEKNPTARYRARFEDLARRAAGTDAAAEAWIQVQSMANGAEDQARGREIVDQLLAGYMQSPAMEKLAGQLRYGWYSLGLNRSKDAMRQLRQRSPHALVQAAATFTLAAILMEQPGAVEGASAGAIIQAGADSPAREQDRREARALFEELGAKHADSSYGQSAQAYLFELDHLQIGMVAPDFEAEDEHGQPFKLSDYRGKVVVLDFWGFW
ncbi:MAG: redoxin domain-containing protein [Planctomycetota bacterium]|nr:MAG: redoxin domain-containing protein [Planctomycetota bacterium]